MKTNRCLTMTCAIVLSLSMLKPAASFAAEAAAPLTTADPVGDILKRCDPGAFRSGMKTVGNYGLIVVETALVGGGLWMIKYGVTKGNVAGSQDDLVSFTGSSAITLALGSEFEGRRAYLIDSFDQNAMTGLATEILYGVPGVYTQKINQSCEAANQRRANSTFVVSCPNVIKAIAQKLNSEQPCDSVEFVESQLQILNR